jgi:hypothetical protein
MDSIHYEISVDTDESDHRLEMLHDNVRKVGTVFNTVTPGTSLSGVLPDNVSSCLFSPVRALEACALPSRANVR